MSLLSEAMQEAHDIWRAVDAAANKIGVKPSALKKWRVRGVPHRHWYSLIDATSGTISARDLASISRNAKQGSPAAQIVAGMSEGDAE